MALLFLYRYFFFLTRKWWCDGKIADCIIWALSLSFFQKSPFFCLVTSSISISYAWWPQQISFLPPVFSHHVFFSHCLWTKKVDCNAMLFLLQSQIRLNLIPPLFFIKMIYCSKNNNSLDYFLAKNKNEMKPVNR